MSGMWKRGYGKAIRHRQTKGAATDKLNLLLPRDNSTLPSQAVGLVMLPDRLSKTNLAR